jgi:hypothetical protein
VVEGHVPADLVKKMLDEKPDIAGLSVPGMVVGSPGMEVPGQPAQPYDVLAFAADGKTAVYAKRRSAQSADRSKGERSLVPRGGPGSPRM